MWNWVEHAGLEAVDDDRVMEGERWKTVQLMGILDKLYCVRLVLVCHIGHHEVAWAAQTGRVVVLARERARVNEVDLQISAAQLMIKQRQEEVHPIQYEKTCCGQSAPVPSPPSRLSLVPSRPSPAPPLLPQQSAVSSQALLLSPLRSQQSQQVKGEEEASRKVDEERVVWNESEKKESENRDEDERKEEPPQQQEHDPSKAKGEPKLIDLFGADGEGAGQQQLTRRQRRQQQQSQVKEGRATNLSVEWAEELQRYDEIVDDREQVGLGTEEEKVKEKMDDGGYSAETKHPLQEKELELVLAKKRAKSLPQQQQHHQHQQQQLKHEGLLPPPPWPPPLSSQKGNVNGEIRGHGTGWFGVDIGATGGVLGCLVGALVSLAW